MPSRRFQFSVNPLWPHYLSWACVGIATLVGLVRYGLLDRTDPMHCNALLTEGRWLDTKFKNWQPDGCMLYQYKPADVASCMASKRVVFVGDSVTRQLFFQFAHVLDPSLPTAPPDDEQKHADYRYISSKSDVQLQFFWDPYLNSTHTHALLHPSARDALPSNTPALLVFGSGLWYLRYADSGGLPAWEAKMESTLAALTQVPYPLADVVAVLPVEDVVPSKLSRERAASMQASDIDAMNSDLLHRISPPASRDPFAFLPGPSRGRPGLPIALPLVFNTMLHPSQTEDGLHFSDLVVSMQAQMLLNLRCNDILPKTFPLDKTCCRRYPWPSVLHLLVLAGAFLWAPANWLIARRFSPQSSGMPLIRDDEVSGLALSFAAALIYVADRTGFWLKEQKQFDPWTFGFLALLSLAAGLLSVKRADNDLGFLNREQTDEWKGWMQIAILIYHYTGASKISGIYNPIRVLVAAYLFMTGYGHTTFYVKKADFGLLRVAQVLVRLNLLTLLLAYTMNTDYISYYFAPLVSQWYLIIYGTMFLGSKYNDRTIFLITKILLSMGVVTWFMSEPWLLEAVFQFLARFCNIQWSAREWAFRVNLDLWIVYFGMFAAIAVMKVREHRITDHPRWPLVVRSAAVLSAVVLLWFFSFELAQADKFAYNLWHPYVSFLPVGAFVVLRNANAILRSGSSRVFAFIGTCSLETFIIQYHLWLAGDTKGILIILPGRHMRPLNLLLTTIIFIYISHLVAKATGEITNWICGKAKASSLPTTQPANPPRPPPPPPESEEGQEVIFMVPQDGDEEPRKDNDGNPIPREPDTPARPPRRWLDRLAEGSPTPAQPSPGFRVWYGESEWTPGLRTKLLIGLGGMWLLNIMWP
ncbi:Cas1p-domain-containing protein [Trametes versicolor FP-101664 SS1]|uniref:Cas1p-domain-containing protein n=1 Tax=Trametes versicolor (strain FP-101664) TaxID=717944 RepID=UPI0004622F54|nr:Cas1p-domain-containing protein [Trametes versicolor FP-101664 SS1]EIW64341.1 Cas1p-domain-containing protein [Trametes versicolor FP-101664 SS1]